MNLRTSIFFLTRTLALAAFVTLQSCARLEVPPTVSTEPIAKFSLARTSFSELANWGQNDGRKSLEAFKRSCIAIAAMPAAAPLTGSGYGGMSREWLSVCQAAANISADDADAAREFFESEFVPYWVADGENEEGLFTGYFEPELRGSTVRQGAFQTPLHGVPADLVSVDLGLFREQLSGQRLAGRVQKGRLVPFDTRAEIARNGLEQAEELLYIDDPIDAFFLHIQGSGRVALEDGSVVRASYAGQNGHPYTAIGAVLIAREELTREEVSMQSIREWLSANPNEAQELLDENSSYIFFSIEPLDDPTLGARGTQGVPLTAGASLAVDANMHPLGVPVWVETVVPSLDGDEMGLHRLLIAQDTGGAIRGAVRGDIYWGVGDAAGEIAGRMRSSGKIAVLLPLSVAQDIGAGFTHEWTAQ